MSYTHRYYYVFAKSLIVLLMEVNDALRRREKYCHRTCLFTTVERRPNEWIAVIEEIHKVPTFIY